MSAIFYSEPELVISLNKRIIFVNPNDLQIFKEIVLPEDLTKVDLKISITDNNDGEQEEKIIRQDLSKEQPTIRHVKMASNQQLLAITTAGQKALLLYTLRPEHAKLVSIRSLARASSALAFSEDCKRLLVTDKTGDCYEYNCENYEALPKLLLGHLSIVYDVLWSKDEKFIITCDRDEKIRITNYPNTYDVHRYCLGHKEFVADLELLSDDVLISVSGDKTLRLWNFKEGMELKCVDLPAPGIKLALNILENDKYKLAVLLHQPNECVVTYELVLTESQQWEVSSPQLYNFNEMICCNLAYAQNRLYVTGIVNNHFVIKVITNNIEVPSNWLGMVEEQFKEYIWIPEDIAMRFKRKYDNVSEYLERKKRRIEEKQK